MATLGKRDGTQTFIVPAQCLAGRSPNCGLQIDEKFASSEHAKLTFNGSRWTIRDLGSSNGTFVDGQRLEPGKPVVVEVGATIGFGDPDEPWALTDTSAPGAIAIDTESGEVRAGMGELLVLPDDQHPEITVYPASQGGGWIAEDAEGHTRPVADQAVIDAAGCKFRLELPVISEATPMADVSMTLGTAALRLAVSQDEETVQVTLIVRGIETHLERREHGYLLLTLARAHAEDETNNVGPSERGWRKVSDLTKMLRLDSNAINVAIHRARHQLAAAGLEGAAGIVEVRRGARRIGTGRFEITRLEE